jgi:hypothetical protein
VKLKAFIFLFFFVLVPNLASAVTRYVRNTCVNGANTYNPVADACITGSSLVYTSIANGIAAMGAGDILYIRSGTYTTYLNGDTFNWPSGSSGSPTTIAGYPGDTVIIRPATESIINMSSSTFGAKTYIKFQNLILDGGVMNSGTQVIGSNGAQTNIEFDHITIRNNPDNNGWSVCATCSNWWIHHSTITNLRGGYGIYNTAAGTIFEYNTISGGDAYAIHSYNQGHTDVSNNTYRYNIITDNGHSAQFSAGAIIANGSNNAFYGNLVYSNLRTGLIIESDCVDCLIYNNTIYSNGASVGGFGIEVRSPTRPILRNNIVASNAGPNFSVASPSSPIHSNNLCEAAGTWCDTTQAVASIFVDVASANFQLKAGSLAIDTGTPNVAPGTTILACAGSIITGCFNGSAPDLGAYETGVPTAVVGGPPTLTPNLTTVAAGAQILLTVDDDDVNERIEDPGDWVGIFLLGSSNTIDWFYMNGTKTAPTVAISDAVLTFTAPSIPGSYEFIFSAANTFNQLARAAFTVIAPGIVMKFNITALKIGPSVTLKIGTP